MTIDATTGELQWTDASASAGVTYQYSVVHVGNETKASTSSPEVAATMPAPSGTDSTGPQLTIVSPSIQQWSAYPRVILHYADAQSGIDPASVRVSFSAALGSRAAGADVSDLANYKDARVFAAPLVPPYSLPINTLVTMTATIADMAGNSTTQTVQFFVTTTSAHLPTAAFTATPDVGVAPVDVAFDATASTDAGGKVVQYEWYFGDGTMSSGATASHRYTTGGSFIATLVVRDTQGGVATATRTITTEGVPAECANGDATPVRRTRRPSAPARRGHRHARPGCGRQSVRRRSCRATRSAMTASTTTATGPAIPTMPTVVAPMTMRHRDAAAKRPICQPRDFRRCSC